MHAEKARDNAYISLSIHHMYTQRGRARGREGVRAREGEPLKQKPRRVDREGGAKGPRGGRATATLTSNPYFNPYPYALSPAP